MSHANEAYQGAAILLREALGITLSEEELQQLKAALGANRSPEDIKRFLDAIGEVAKELNKIPDDILL